MAASKTPSQKKTTSKTSTPSITISPPSVGRPEKGTLSRREEELHFNRVGCLCSKCGRSLFGPSTEDKMSYKSNGKIKQLTHLNACIPLCQTCDSNSEEGRDLIRFKLEAEQRATLELGVSPNDHITDSGIIIVLIRKRKAKIKRSDMNAESLLKELQFINPLDLHYRIPEVANEIALFYYEIFCKCKNENVQYQIIKKISQQLVSMTCYADPGAITQDFILNLCKILIEAEPSIFESETVKLFLESITPMIVQNKEYIMQKINNVPDTNSFITYIKKKIY